MLGGSGELFKGSKTNKLSFFIIKLEPLLDLVDCLWPLSGGEIMLGDIIYNVFDQRPKIKKNGAKLDTNSTVTKIYPLQSA